VITIQSGMLIALGFLAAALLGLLIAPALWRRAVRLTTRRIKTTIPLSEMEIEADRDRIRAEYAIKMHKLEMLVEQVKLTGARQQIEINRRDARVNLLEADLEQLRASYEEAQNARRVLEQTIADRLPRVETRLAEAKKVLNAREQEIVDLNAAAEKQVQALASARALNDEQQQEIERLDEALSEARGQLGGGESGLRAELQSLKAKTREQAQLIGRLQGFSGRRRKAVAIEADNAPQNAEFEREISALRARNEDQSAEIARLKAAIDVFEKNADGELLGSMRESRLALKARAQALEAQTPQQTETLAKLRSELAGANERLAQQAAHFTNELKRLGSGATGGRSSRRGSTAARPSLAERVSRTTVASEGDATSSDGGKVDVEPAWQAADAIPQTVVAPDVAADGNHGGVAPLADDAVSASSLAQKRMAVEDEF
jgi:chromosome segregation ATPase